MHPLTLNTADTSCWWEGAADYVERVARVMTDVVEYMPSQAAVIARLPFAAPDLQDRLRRIRALEELCLRAGARERRLRDALRRERADLMIMADVVMTELELTAGRATLDTADRLVLQGMISAPLSLWHQWLERR